MGASAVPSLRNNSTKRVAEAKAKGQSIVKYRDSVQKQLNRSRCRFGCGHGWAHGTMR